MSFRRKLLDTLGAVSPVLDVPGVLVARSEVPNLLEPDAAATLVVSRGVDLMVPVGQLAAVKARLEHVDRLGPADDEPSVWIDDTGELLEVSFLGVDPEQRDLMASYALDDAELPLMVFGPLSLLREGPAVQVEDLRIPLPRLATLLLEKLVSERSGDKGDRDLLVALGLLTLARPEEVDEAEGLYRGLPAELRHAARSNLGLMSLLQTRPLMPDPAPHRALVRALLQRLERGEDDLP